MLKLQDSGGSIAEAIAMKNHLLFGDKVTFVKATVTEKEKAIGQVTNGFWKMNKQNY